MNFLVLLLASVIFSVSAKPCPFNDVCDCTDTNPPNFGSYAMAICNSSTLPDFAISDLIEYRVGKLKIISPVATIPENYLVAFDTIGQLYLEDDGTSPAPNNQNWDAKAFASVKIKQLYVTGVADVIPHGPYTSTFWTIEIGKNGLERLSIYKSGGSITLSQFDSLAPMKLLRKLEIVDSPIASIDDIELSRLKFLSEITFDNAALVQVKFVQSLPRVTTLILDNNQNLKISSFLAFSNLKTLSLKNIQFSNSIDDGVLGYLPTSLTNLYLDDGYLTSISGQKFFLSKIPNLVVSLANNQITKIYESDLQNFESVQKLNLRGNPMFELGSDAFSHLSSATVLDVSETFLPSLDLQVFSNVGSANTLTYSEIFLDNSAYLRSMTVTKWPYYGTSYMIVHVRNSSLVTIDDNVAILLDRAGSKVKFQLDLSNNVNLRCYDLKWMAYYVSCSGQVIIDGASCADQDGMLLENYLKSVVPKPCAKTTTAQPTFPTYPTYHPFDPVTKGANTVPKSMLFVICCLIAMVFS